MTGPEYQDLRRYKMSQILRGRSVLTVQLWQIVQMTLFRWSPKVAYGWRSFLLRCFGAEIGHGARIQPSAAIFYPWKVRIGEFSWIGDRVCLYSLDRIEIGSHVVISQNSYLCGGAHDITRPTFDTKSAPIMIEDEVWLAADVFVYPGVRIGRGAVVCARSTVRKDLAGEWIYSGFPAVPIQKRRKG